MSYSHDWWTPEPWLDWARRTFGGDFHDPCPRDYAEGDGTNLHDPTKAGTYWNHPGTGRGAAGYWWRLARDASPDDFPMIWCAFNHEQIHSMEPCPWILRGWMVMPRRRVPFIWGGPDLYDEPGNRIRTHGEPARSPRNRTYFWTNVHPAEPPEQCIVIPTGNSAYTTLGILM